MWFLTFVDALQQGVSGAFTPYVTSNFHEHSLTAYVNVMAGVIAGVLRLPLAQVLNIWGRPQGYTLAMGSIIIGLIMMCACDGVQMYSAAQVFYW